MLGTTPRAGLWGEAPGGSGGQNDLLGTTLPSFLCWPRPELLCSRGPGNITPGSGTARPRWVGICPQPTRGPWARSATSSLSYRTAFPLRLSSSLQPEEVTYDTFAAGSQRSLP